LNTQDNKYDFSSNGVEPPKEPGIDLNYKRVFARVIKYWYLIVLSLMVAVSVAFIINRYSPRIYPVRASIIILQNEENAGAQFLYDNELVKPFRNFYNELFIMRSYPLLTEVMEELNFDVSYYREGNIKTLEYYDPDFPIEFKVLGRSRPYGKSVNLVVKDQNTFSLELLFEDAKVKQKKFESLHFNDTIRINSYTFVLRKKGDLTPVINKLFLVRFNDPFGLARQYSTKLIVGWAQLGASVVNLEVNGEVPQKEVDFLNKFIEKYQQYDIDKKNKMATMAIGFLNSQLKFMGDSLNLLEDKVENFKRRNVVTNLGGETSRLYLKVESLQDQKLQFNLRENYYKYISELLANEQYDGIFTPSSVGVTDNVVSGLITSLIAARTNIIRYQDVEKKDQNPLYREQLARIRQIKSDIVKTIENTRKTEAINVRFMNDQIRLLESELRTLPTSERELIDIQRDYSLKEKLYVFLLQKRTEAGLSKASTVSDIVTVNPPISGSAISPKEEDNYLIAFGLGLLLPLAGFVLAELLNTRIQSREDIEKITSIPVIGGVGHNPSDDPLIVMGKPRSAIAESFRALRSNLNYFTKNRSHMVLMVTSSLPGEGKSFTALNLASVFAMAGKKTLIIGADLRRPKLFDELGLKNTFGLSQYLSGLATLADILQQTKIEKLDLISGGPMPPNPSELLLRPEMDGLIDKLRKEYNYIIIDTPPLTFVADSFVLSKFADHSIFVVRQDYTPRAALRTIDEYYSTGKISNVSVLFNDLRKSGPGYGYGAYAYGYGYGYSYGKKKSKMAGYYEE
jgi:capsular exopolysaccharide synthesis family protein